MSSATLPAPGPVRPARPALEPRRVDRARHDAVRHGAAADLFDSAAVFHPGQRRAGQGGQLRRPGAFRHLLPDAQPAARGLELGVGGAVRGADLGAHGLRLRLRPHAHQPARAVQGHGAADCDHPAARALAAVGHLLRAMVRQPGRAEVLAGRLFHLRRARHHPGRGLQHLPACADDPGDGPVAGRGRLYEAATCARRAGASSHHHAAVLQVRPDQRRTVVFTYGSATSARPR